jgi:uncharacterized protein (DUF885 family)
MKRLAVAAALVLAGCHSPGGPAAGRSEPFDRFAAAFVASHYAARPLEAVALGLHEHDGRFVVPERGAIELEIARLKHSALALDAVNPAKLSADQRRELEVLQTTVANARWGLASVQAPWRNPMFYAGALDVSVYLKRDFAPLRDRVRMMTSVLSNAPALFAAARGNLDANLARPLVETAIEIAEGTASFLEKDVSAEAAKSGDPAVNASFNAAAGRAVAELKAFAAWLRETRLPSAHDRFAIGRAAYTEMLRTELVDLTPEAVQETGLRELAKEQARFVAAAREIDPARPAAEVFKEIQRDHPTEQSLLPDTRRDLETIRAFVLKKGLLTIPSEVRARVEYTLPPFRATSFASMDTPGPFERKATEAYYYVTPPEPEWPQPQKDEWLTAYNYYTTDVVSIHEAYPGHYVQFLALNASPIGPVGKVFVSYAFTEGWAHYTEQLLVDAGFGGPEDPAAGTHEEKVRGAKYRLAQSSEALLRLCRLCCSVKLHCQGMSVDEATRFFVANAFYETRPAHSEALRGTFDPGYCFYTLGKLQILKLREDVRRQDGPAFDLKRFHDALLAHGAPPIRVLREILLKDPKSWPEVL